MRVEIGNLAKEKLMDTLSADVAVSAGLGLVGEWRVEPPGGPERGGEASGERGAGTGRGELSQPGQGEADGYVLRRCGGE